MIADIFISFLLLSCALAQTLTCSSGMSPSDLIQTGNAPSTQAPSPPLLLALVTTTEPVPSSFPSTPTQCLPLASKSPHVSIDRPSCEPIPNCAEQDPNRLWLPGGRLPYPGCRLSPNHPLHQQWPQLDQGDHLIHHHLQERSISGCVSRPWLPVQQQH